MLRVREYFVKSREKVQEIRKKQQLPVSTVCPEQDKKETIIETCVLQLRNYRRSQLHNKHRSFGKGNQKKQLFLSATIIGALY